MLTSLALLAVPLAQGHEDSAAQHLAGADFFVDVPNVERFVQAWMGTALPNLLLDPELKGLYELAGLSGPADILGQIPEQQFTLVLGLAKNIKGISLSLSADENGLAELLPSFGILTSQDSNLNFLNDLIEGTYYGSGVLPQSLDEIGFGDDLLLDAFGNPFHYSPDADGAFLLLALGSDGEIGGRGLAADQAPGLDVGAHLISSLAGLVGGQLIIEWNDATLVEPQLGMLLGRLQEEFPLLQQLQLPAIVESPHFPPTAFRLDPGAIGGEEGGWPIEVSFQSTGSGTVVTFGIVKGQSVQAPLKSVLQGKVHPESLAALKSYQESMSMVAMKEGALVWRGFIGEPDKGVAPSTEAFDVFLELFGLSTRSGSWETRIADGAYISNGFSLAAERPSSGSIARVASLVPNNAAFVQAGTLEPHGMWDLFMSLTKQSDEISDLIDSLEVDVEADLVGNLGSEFALWVNPIRGLSVPEVFLVIPVTNGDKVMGAIDSVFDLLAEVDSEISVSRRPYKGINYSSLNIGIPIGLVPTFTVLGDELWVSNSSILIKREIRARAKGEPEDRGEHVAFTRLLNDEGQLPANLRRAGSFDLGGVLAAYYKGALAFSGMLTMGMDLPDGFLEALPPGDIFARHIAPSFSESVATERGLLTHSVGPFGPEPALIGFATVGAAFATFTLLGEVGPPADSAHLWIEVEPLEIEVHAPGPVAQSIHPQVTLALVDVGLLLYSIDNGHMPRGLGSLLKTSKAYPNGYIGELTVPEDGWGNGLYYRALGGDEYILYSFGPDGVDNGGKGDDLTP